jgi:triacylglycerol esterase/lipase EstA (alpha/beta hydrolase family)
VAAIIDGVTIATTLVSGGNYGFSVAQPVGSSFEGRTIRFTLDGVFANQTTTWTANGGAVLNLTATTPSHKVSQAQLVQLGLVGLLAQGADQDQLDQLGQKEILVPKDQPVRKVTLVRPDQRAHQEARTPP